MNIKLDILKFQIIYQMEIILIILIIIKQCTVKKISIID